MRILDLITYMYYVTFFYIILLFNTIFRFEFNLEIEFLIIMGYFLCNNLKIYLYI